MGLKKLWDKLHPKRFVVIVRKVDDSGILWWLHPVSNQRRAGEYCSELNDESMMDGSGWYYTFRRADNVAEWMTRTEIREAKQGRDGL